MTDLSNPGGRSQEPTTGEAPYRLRNYGPWTVVEYDVESELSIGHTTRYGGGAGVRFQQGETTDLFMSMLAPDAPYFSAEQVHGPETVQIQSPSQCHRGVDGLVSPLPEHVMLLRTADCMPVYVWNQREPMARRALLHAGWRGLVSGIVPEAIEQYFAGDVGVFVGPHIRVEDYEVGSEVVSRIEQSLDLDRKELVRRNCLTDSSHANLFEILRRQLSRLGRDVTLFRSPMDSAQSDPVPLLSYRKQQSPNRMLNWFGAREGRG